MFVPGLCHRLIKDALVDAHSSRDKAQDLLAVSSAECRSLLDEVAQVKSDNDVKKERIAELEARLLRVEQQLLQKPGAFSDDSNERGVHIGPASPVPGPVLKRPRKQDGEASKPHSPDVHHHQDTAKNRGSKALKRDAAAADQAAGMPKDAVAEITMSVDNANAKRHKLGPR